MPVIVVMCVSVKVNEEGQYAVLFLLYVSDDINEEGPDALSWC